MSEFILIISELMLCLYQGYVFSYFLKKRLGIKKKSKGLYYPVTSAACALPPAVMLFVSEKGENEHIALAFAAILVPAFVCCFVFLGGSLLKKALNSLLAAVLFTGTFGISYLLFERVLLQTHTRSRFSLVSLIVLAFTECLSFLVFKAALDILRTSVNRVDTYQLDRISSVCFALSALIVTASQLAVIRQNDGFIGDVGKDTVVQSMILLVIVLAVLFFHTLTSMTRKHKLEAELGLVKMQEHYQRQYLENSKLQYDSLKKLRHDTKNSFLAIAELIRVGNTQEAAELASEYTDRITASQSYVNTQNSIVNAIVNCKLSSAVEMGVKVSCISTQRFDGIDDADLCSLLSNMLDNAVSACLEIPQGRPRELFVEMSCESGSCYSFLVKNSVSEPVLENNPKLETTKEDTEKHGLGRQIISDIAKKYNGRADCYEQHSLFCCQVDLIAKAKGVNANG